MGPSVDHPLIAEAFGKLDRIAHELAGLREDQGQTYDDAKRESFSAIKRLIADGANTTTVTLTPRLGEIWHIRGIAVQADTAAARNVALQFGDGRPIAVVQTVVGTIGVGGVVAPDYKLPDGGQLEAIFPAATPANTECILHVWGERIMPEPE